MESALLFRPELTTKYELRHAQQHMRTETSRVACQDCIVIGRYSIMPFYEELERDLTLNRSKLIHTFEQHQWITSFKYYQSLKEFTPETWFEENFYQCTYNGPFVVKGKIKSKKFQWASHMFAKTKSDAIQIAETLKRDSEIADDGIVYRKYIPLRTFENGPNGLPYTNEWRLFYLGTNRLCCGYYWSLSDCIHQGEITESAMQFADQIAEIAAKHTNFFVLDIAETTSGEWILIEINDGQMSELSENDPNELYGNLKKVLSSWQVAN